MALTGYRIEIENVWVARTGNGFAGSVLVSNLIGVTDSDIAKGIGPESVITGRILSTGWAWRTDVAINIFIGSAQG